MAAICRKSGLATLLGLFFALAAPLVADESWSLKPLVRPTPPAEGNAVDAFIQAKLAEAGVRQNDAADPHTLLRRMTLDLTGLPPTREEIRMANDETRKQVDRLLASPHYGERWGRHWLDVARYVQGTIKVPASRRSTWPSPIAIMWCGASTRTNPTTVSSPSSSRGICSKLRRSDHLVAPAFLSIGQWFEECTDPNKLRLDLIDEQISTATRAFLAMDFACARLPRPQVRPHLDPRLLRPRRHFPQHGDHLALRRGMEGRTPPRLASARTEAEVTKAGAIDREIAGLREERLAFLTEAQKKVAPKAASEIPGTVLTFEAEHFDGHKDLKTISIGEGEAVALRRAIEPWCATGSSCPIPGAYTLLVRYAATEPSPVELEIEGKFTEGRVLGEATHGETPDHFRGRRRPRGTSRGTLFRAFQGGRNEPFPTLDRSFS